MSLQQNKVIRDLQIFGRGRGRGRGIPHRMKRKDKSLKAGVCLLCLWNSTESNDTSVE